eukprot:g6851.t1
MKSLVFRKPLAHPMTRVANQSIVEVHQDHISEPRKYTKLITRIVIIVILLTTAVLAFTLFDAEEKLEDLLEWIDKNQVPGFFIFVLAYVLATVLLIPGSLMSLGAGFVFGIFLGALAVWIGAVIGQTLGFLCGRYLLREWVTSYATRFKLWRGLEIAAKEEGWKIVSLLRLAPIIPYNALNYALGLTAVSFIEYFIASAVFILPGVFLFVYLGSLANDLRELTSSDSPVDATVTIIIAVVSGVFIIAVVVLTSRYAKRALDRLVIMENEEESNDDSIQQTQNHISEN